MKRFLLFVLAYSIGIGCVDAAVRSTESINRNSKDSSVATVIARAATNSAATIQGQDTTNRTTTNTTTRDTGNIISRTASTKNITQSNVSRSATAARSTSNSAQSATSRNAANNSVVRTTATPRKTVTPSVRSALTPGRASTISTSSTNTFGTSYNSCRDAYFTCMDQFCANANDSYRRCVCSSRLSEIQEKERALSQSANQIQDFKDLNLEVIPKTAEEVKAMLSASEGESAIKTDNSASAQKLAGISDVLSSTKSKSLSTLGTLDIAGDINQIWATTDLASGENIINLTGESLYNAVHAQCAELVSGNCTSTATFNMVVSAYGMYIENDCTTLANALDKSLNQANSTIRDTEREMNMARLDNYNAHNSTSINDCIAQVRKDITADNACGEDYVHCLDITGRYLNRETGEPIYTQDFYQLEAQTSLSGDILTNPTNRMLVAELNRKRSFAERGLETCRDIADEVWDEFMRQAITEIYQGQQEKIRNVKNECLDVVNTCYDEQSESLKDFTNIKEELLLGSRLELSEELCQEKLYACSNLYGDPNGNGLELLITAMHNITDQKIAQECATLLKEFAVDMCAVPSNDSLHSYPYGCRVYAPGDQIYAANWFCNQLQWSSSNDSVSEITPEPPTSTPSKGYICPSYKRYTSCNVGYYLATKNESGSWVYNSNPVPGNACIACPADAQCPGGTKRPVGESFDTEGIDCGTDYAGSLYQKMVKYAAQVCIRPSDLEEITAGRKNIPTTVLEDVNVVMDSIRVEMAKVLSAECERLGGVWVDTQWVDTMHPKDANSGTTTRAPSDLIEGSDNIHDITGHILYKYFYDETGANTKWGYCADKEQMTATDEEGTDDTTGQ